MMHVAHCPPGGPDSPARRTRDFVPYADDEIRAALCLTRRAAGEQLSLAAALVDRLPRVHQALAAGEIDLPRALARAARRAGDHRSLQQLRADTFLDLLEGLTLTAAHPAERPRPGAG